VTNNDSAYAPALDLVNAGVSIAAIVDLRATPTGALADRGAPQGHRDPRRPCDHRSAGRASRQRSRSAASSHRATA
jgi:hypothetical protein